MHRSSVPWLKIFVPGFSGNRSAYHVNIHLDGTVDDALGIGLIEQVHQDLPLLHRNAGVGGHGIAVDELAVGGGDVQQRAVGDHVRVHRHGAVAQAQAGGTLAGLGVVAGGLAGEHLAVRSRGVGGAVRARQRGDRRACAIGLDDVAGGLHGGGGIHHDAVLQLTVHIAVAGGDGLLALRAVLHGGGAAGVAEVEAGVDVLGVIGDGLGLHAVLIVHAVHRDLGARSHQLVQRGFGVVIALQGDACALQGVGDGAEHHLHRVLLAVGGDADGEGALNVQGGEVAAVGRVIDLVAFLGLDAGKIEEVLADRSGVMIANYNCPGQIVITGWKEDVEQAADALKEAGAKRVLPLNVSGPFHSSLLKQAGEELGKELEQVDFSDLQIPYVTNVTAEYVTDITKTKELLARQVASSVRWQQSMELLIADGVDTFVEIGPGRTLAGFLRKINREVKVYNVGTWEDVDKVVNELC